MRIPETILTLAGYAHTLWNQRLNCTATNVPESRKVGSCTVEYPSIDAWNSPDQADDSIVFTRNNFDPIQYTEKPWTLLHHKDSTLSVVAVSGEAHRHPLYLQSQQVMPNHTFFANSAPSNAFNNYSFTLLIGSDETMSKSLVFAATSAHTISIIVDGPDRSFWDKLSYEAWDALWTVNGIPSLPILVGTLSTFIHSTNSRDSERVMMMYRNLRVLQNILLYRYNTSAYERLAAIACNQCMRKNKAEPEVFIAIFSGRANWGLRQAIRDTWLMEGVDYKFYIGLGDGGLIREEIEQFNDIVELQIHESYRNLTQKGFLMFENIAEKFSNFDFILVFDDDVYIRLPKILNKLHNTRPVNYWWGIFTHLSQPVRDPSDAKNYVSYTDYPNFEVFPVYSRGFAFAMSMDLVSLVTRHPQRSTINNFDAAIGVTVQALIVAGITSVNIDDTDSEKFALNPICKHPYFPLTSKSWIIHHVSADFIRCAWNADKELVNNLCHC